VPSWVSAGGRGGTHATRWVAVVAVFVVAVRLLFSCSSVGGEAGAQGGH
jgi:hypothetical protein